MLHSLRAGFATAAFAVVVGCGPSHGTCQSAACSDAFEIALQASSSPLKVDGTYVFDVTGAGLKGAHVTCGTLPSGRPTACSVVKATLADGKTSFICEYAESPPCDAPLSVDAELAKDGSTLSRVTIHISARPATVQVTAAVDSAGPVTKAFSPNYDEPNGSQCDDNGDVKQCMRASDSIALP